MRDSTIIGDTICPQCRANGGDRTGNHLILYSNGNKYCNRCGYKELGERTGAHKVTGYQTNNDIIDALPTLGWRGVDAEILRSYGVRMDINETNGDPDHIYFPVYGTETNERLGWKVRKVGEKSFETIGNLRGIPKQFFGQWLCRDGGKLLIIVEGESDTLAAKQILTDHGKGFYSVVGLSFGANSADKLAKDNLAWLDSFESVIVVPDQDKPGKLAAEKLASIIGFKKCKIATLDAKDTAELLEQERSGEWMKALSTAKSYTPRGIVEAANFKSEFFSRPSREGIPFAPIFAELNEATKGVARGEVAMYTGGTGCGKSQFCDENIVYWLQQGYRVGVLKMEHDLHTNIDNLLGTYMGVNIKLFPDAVSDEDKSKAYDELYTTGRGSLFLIDHAFEDTSDDGFFQKMRELAVVSDCDIIVVDHLHALLYSVEDGQGSEHTRTDTIMRTLAQTAKQYNVAIHVVAHPRKSGSSSKSAEEGGYISLDDIKGSSSMKQVPDIIITMQRDITSETLEERNTVVFSVLKNRYLGIVGVKQPVLFNVDTLRYSEPPQIEEF